MNKLTSSETMLKYLQQRIYDLSLKAKVERSAGNIMQYATYSTQVSVLNEVVKRLTKGEVK
ncbi:hypothetical protein [Liquorilactobacillus capillatus]|uniref:Uncharacterized protein n=1 Tax=Liquorilactobacillus capillatus DSM 19910 TaxID=1423731 RepID=A0A0R1M3H6_9LACO|nr:hypothetical protein [Liquorilactobacillus capillatus]KRL02510.1 hypothetical protein FC81_GL000675 [Liquorilactobacillus capillatus DSM 19910]